MPNYTHSPRVSSANVHLGPKRYDADGEFLSLSERPEFQPYVDATRATLERAGGWVTGREIREALGPGCIEFWDTILAELVDEIAVHGELRPKYRLERLKRIEVTA